jgi:hypothetical protein
MSGVLVIACKVEDYNATTEVCAAPFYTYPPSSVLPALTLADAQALSVAIAYLWAVAWGIRRLKKLLDQLN